MLGFIVSPLAVRANTSVPVSADIISEINKERLSRGMSALKFDPLLSQAAQSRSGYLAGQGQIFHVTAPAGTPWPVLSQAGYQYTLAGENLALGIETSRELASRWMASPTHRDNILHGQYEDIGVGVTSGYYGNQEASYVVVYFGKKRPGAVSVSSPTTVTSLPKTYPSGASGGTTQATVASSQSIPYVLPASHSLPVNPEQEKIRLLNELITALGSYLMLMRTNAGLI